jgi:hypothetical protein
VSRYLDTAVRPDIDVDLALRAVLQHALAGTGVRVDPAFPGPDRLPSVSATRSGGIPDWPPGAIDRPRVDINTWAEKRQEASDLARETVAYLKSCEGDTITFGDGTRFVLAAVDTAAGLFIDQDASTSQGIYRGVTSVVLTIHQRSPMR